MGLRKFLCASVACAGAVVFAGSASALTITEMDDHALSITDWFDTLSVSQFDPAQGTLNSVKITFEASMLSDMILDNDDATPDVAQGTATVDTIGSFVGLGSLGINLSDNTGFQNLAADDSGNTDSPGDGGLDEFAGVGLADGDMLMTTLLPGDPDFASFIGLGSLSTVGLGTLGGFSVRGVLGSGDNVDVNVNTQASAKITVVYDFDVVAPPPPPNNNAVPEPITSALGLMGLGVLGVATKRRRA